MVEKSFAWPPFQFQYQDRHCSLVKAESTTFHILLQYWFTAELFGDYCQHFCALRKCCYIVSV